MYFQDLRSTIAEAKPSPKGSRHPFECRRIRKHNINQHELYTSKRKVNEKILGLGWVEMAQWLRACPTPTENLRSVSKDM